MEKPIGICPFCGSDNLIIQGYSYVSWSIVSWEIGEDGSIFVDEYGDGKMGDSELWDEPFMCNDCSRMFVEPDIKQYPTSKEKK